MIFKQLFDKTSSTFTYLIADPVSKEALFIDPVNTNIDEYLALLKTDDLQLKYLFETLKIRYHFYDEIIQYFLFFYSFYLSICLLN